MRTPRWLTLLIGLLVLAAPRIALAGEPEAYQFLAERMDRYAAGEQPRLIESYAPPYPPGPDGTLEHVAFTYDNALAVAALVARSASDDLRRARLICDALLWYQQHDPSGDGRLRQAYRADESAAGPTSPTLLTGFAHSYTGDLAWAGLALVTFFERVRDTAIADPLADPNARYLQAALDLEQFLSTRLRDDTDPGIYLGFQENTADTTVGVPLAAYGTLTTTSQQITIPLADVIAQGLNPARLRALSFVFADPNDPAGEITVQAIRLVNQTTGAALVIDDFADTNPVTNALGHDIGGIVDISAHPTGRVLRWHSDDGSVDYWYSLLVADPSRLPRLDASPYTHLVLEMAGAAGGERLTVELQGYPAAQRLLRAKATEHNLDYYVLVKRLTRLTDAVTCAACAESARHFVEETAWDAAGGKFWAGTVDDAETLNHANLTLDQQGWAVLALGRLTRYSPVFAWADATLRTVSDGFSGFDYGTNVAAGDPWYTPVPDGIWFEGTAQLVCAYQVSGRYGGLDLSAFYLGELDRAQQTAAHTNGKGLPAASRDGVTTGFPYFTYFASPHVGATAWYIAAKRRVNFLWNTSTDAPVPYNQDNLPPVLTAIGNRTVAEGQPVMFTAVAADPEGEAVTYGATPLPAGATFDTTTGAFAWMPGCTQAGAYPVTVIAADSQGLQDIEAVTITVTAANCPPIVAPPGSYTVKRGSTLRVDIYASDPDNNVKTMTIKPKPLPAGASWKKLSLGHAQFTWKPTSSNPLGTYTFTITATDTTGLQAGQPLTVKVLKR